MIEIRKAAMADSADVLLWRNDGVTREMSRNTGTIAGDEHEKWFMESLERNDRVFYIGETEGEKIGMVRFDQREGDDWEVNINLNPAMRGRKLSLALLEQAITRFTGERNPRRILAVIKTTNVPSQKIFGRAGFQLAGRDGDFERHELRVTGEGD